MGSMPNRFEQQVETNSGIMADCANGYQEAGENIDLQAKHAVAQGCRVINPAPGAMRLPHVEHLPMDNIQVEPLEQPAREIIARNVPATDKSTRTQLYKEELGEVNRILKEMGSIKELSRKALNLNAKVYSKGGQGNGLHNKSGTIDPITAKKVDRIDKQLNAKYTDTIEFIKRYDVGRFVPLLGLDIGELEELVQNSQIYFQAMIDNCDELTDILRQSRIRIMSRIEEDIPQPNIQHLLEQWRHDQQPGRAIHWAQQHANYVTQLPDEQQQALRTFQDTFNSTVEELGRDYIAAVKQEAELHSTASRAKEFFMCGDQQGMKRLLAGLQTHHDQKQATYFTPLLQGYIAELRNQQTEAVDAYQKIVEGSAHLDALMRLFGLHTKTQDWDSALEVLKNLSAMCAIYTPMYADMLQSTGDVDTAVEIYTEYLLTNPDDLDTMMKLGKLFLDYGSTEGVEWTMGYILGKDPGNHTAQKILNKLELSMETDSTHS